MQLIIDSGASKSDWLVFDKANYQIQQSIGINPISNDNADLIQLPFSDIEPLSLSNIYFYGAGTGGAKAKQSISNTLSKIFNKATIEVETDLLGAARATSNNSISIVSIMGTGVNCALFDGKEIKSSIPSLGYLFGDIGSGFSIGQEVIRSYFHGYMDENDRDRFEEKFGSDREAILSAIYKSDKPNYEIASFAKFLNNAAPEYRNYILEPIFNKFCEHKIRKIQNARNFPLNFVGSIAFYFQDILKQVCKMNGYQVNNVIDKPILKLYEYHLANEKE